MEWLTVSNQSKQDESDVLASIDKESCVLQNVQANIKIFRERVSQQINFSNEQTSTINELNTRIQTIETEKATILSNMSILENDFQNKIQQLETEKVAISSAKDELENKLQQQLDNLQSEKLAVITEKEDIEADSHKQIQALEAEKTTIASNMEELETNLTKQLKDQEIQFKTLENEQSVLSSDKGLLEADLQKKAAEYDTLMSQFKNISEEYQSIQEKDQENLDVSQLLALYIALVEDIYAARPHIRILWLLHGDKGVTGMSRQELAKASGFEPIAVLRAIQELAAAGFCGYDEETHQTTLERRIFK